MKGFRKIDEVALFMLLAGILLPAGIFAQTDEYIRSYLTVQDGLSQNEVTAIGEDKYGFMWFGTRGGLNRYDSYNFSTYKPTHTPGESILNPSVECLYFDREGKSWIGTKSGGISMYDPVSDRFFAGDSLVGNDMNRVVTIFQGMDGIYWIGGFYEGLMSFDPATRETKTWMTDVNIQSIVETPDSTIWVGTRNSLSFIRPGGEFQHFSPVPLAFSISEIVIDPDQPYLWFSGWNLPLVRLNYEDFSYELYELPERMSRIYSLLDDHEGNIWIGTWGSGLYRFDKKTAHYDQVDIYPDDRFSLISDYDIILDIYRDSRGLIWVGTDGGGVVLFSPSRGFHSVNSFVNGQKYHVTCLMETNEGDVLLGTRNQGLLLSQGEENISKVTVADDEEDGGINVYYLGNENPDYTWVGMEQGLYVMQEKPGREPELVPAARYFNSPALSQGLRKVLGVLQRGNELWIATQQRGLLLFHWEGDSYELIRTFNSSTGEVFSFSNRVSGVLVDKSGHLWAGTYDGLYRYRDADSVFVPVEQFLSNSLKPLCNIVLCTYLDADNHLWFGTPCSMNKLEQAGADSYVLHEFTKDEGLPDDYISNILGDAEGNIWFTNNRGISKLDKASGTIYNYESGDGTGEYNFSESAAFRSTGGVIYFGSFSGYTFFHPAALKINRTIPPIAISGFKVMNREVEVDPEGILPVSINEVEKIVLGHKDREISFEFVALDYKSPENNQYKYKLEKRGVESDWEYIGNRRMVSFQNLKPGDYTLYVMGSNSNGIWNEESKSLDIKVLATPLKRWYAVVAYFLFILLIVALILQTSLRQERLRTEAQMEHVQREQEQQMNELKLRFFTNISHELKTPLSMILAPLNELLINRGNELPRSVIRKLGMIKSNADRLLKLVSQLIEFRKVEAGKVKLEAARQDLVVFLKEIIQPFSELAVHKGITFKADYQLNKVPLFFDARKLSIVMNNLLNNAIKYAGDPGHVFVQLSDCGAEICISFRNDGEGISPADIHHIFDRFYQVSSSRYLDSSGIGLALVKHYVEMHKGTITVDSAVDAHTTFEVRLKKGRDHLSDEEISEGAAQVILKEDFLMEKEEPSKAGVFHHMGTKGAKIVVIDDNKDVREFLYDLFSDYYEVSLAENGKVGFDTILEVKPDLVLSDIMMPEMDGYDLCEKVKAHEHLSHIPFVMLTAKGTASDMIFGTRKGADYYLTKPFDSELILEKVRQILSSRKQLVSKYSRKIMLDPVSKEITSEDERILKAAIKVVEENIENENLNLEMLSDKLAMSSSTLYRKMKAVCGQSPGEFIRTVRFKRAAQLLRDSDLTVSEIIEQVGYNSVKQFRENFKTEYGTSPANYRKQFRE